MGLDQYAFRHKGNATPSYNAENEIFYWRKHPNLHGWMQRIYAAKTGDSNIESFNCVALELSAEDIDRLERDILAGTLPDTSGFFFGRSSGDDEEKARDLEFIEKAREALALGYRVFYDSWW